ncbi:MAG TPA: hypothetical protein VG410_00735 [Solirubrobacteraceae bacterium]|jgi:hypothetical protein|nr:hypothetical protein [Solirubrobacteraceae bacterium]
MKEIHIGIGVLAIALSAAAFSWGAYCYWRTEESRWFWRLLRSSQVAIVLEAALGGIYAINHKTPSIHIIYGVLPILVSFLAEQLRVASAQMVLDRHGFESSADVGKLPEGEQRGLVDSILLREMGVMTLSALVCIVLLARAAGTA